MIDDLINKAWEHEATNEIPLIWPKVVDLMLESIELKNMNLNKDYHSNNDTNAITRNLFERLIAIGPRNIGFIIIIIIIINIIIVIIIMIV